MDHAVAAQQAARRLPRYFWRRALAFMIDALFFELVLLAILYALSYFTPLNLTVPFFSSTQCSPVTSGALVEKVEEKWPLQSGETRVNQLCHVSWPGGGYDAFTTSTTRTDGRSFQARSVSVLVDQDGNPAEETETEGLPPLIATALIVLAFAWFTANGRRTPGKIALKLRVRTNAGASPDVARAVCRETLKFLPLLVDTVLPPAISLAGSSQDFDELLTTMRNSHVTAIDALFSWGVGLGIAGLVWWFLPFFLWRGRTFYDRITGCEVAKV